MGGVYRIPAARFLTSPSRVSERVSVENWARQLTNCADRRGPAFESPRSQAARFRADAKIRDLRRRRGGNPEIGVSTGRHGGALSDVPVACLEGVCGANGVQKLTNCADRRGPAFESRPAHRSPRAQVAQFRADAKICDFRRHCWGSPEIGISGSRQDIMGGVYRIPAARSLTSPLRVSDGLPAKTGSGN